MSEPERASRWLTSILADGRIDCRPDKPTSTVYLFDLGMIAQGLLRYGTYREDAELIESGLKLVRTIRQALPHGGEPLAPIIGAHRLPPTWSTAGTAHLLKLLLPLLTAARLGDEASLPAAHRLITAAGTPFAPDRTPEVITCPGADVVSLHAACYAAEGLWAFGAGAEDTESAVLARRITRWVWGHQLAGGGFPGFVSRDGRPAGGPQSDVLAQAIRLAHLTQAQVDGLDRAVDALTASAAAVDGEGIAIVYSPGSAARHLNTWASMFAAQALDLHEIAGHRIDWPDFV
ncbi:hypothetical protein ACQEVC_42365 [Plantactinospora sp. CA-294935]|uniref:hypothetical protein n=1 Tax=Plantactinospora sp. CA-294935 TaxID=3240012 RepID=UPI003D9252C3